MKEPTFIAVVLIYAPVIALFIQSRVNKSNQRFPIIKERYEKVFFPIYVLIEPYLFKELPLNVLHKTGEIIKDNQRLAGFKTKWLFEQYENEISNEKEKRKKFNSFCNHICYAIDEYAPSLGLDMRSYKKIRDEKQYSSKLSFFKIICVYYTKIVLIWLIMIAAVILTTWYCYEVFNLRYYKE